MNPTLDRHCHWLRRNAKEKRPDLIVFLDTESHITQTDSVRSTHTFRLGFACLTRYNPYNGLNVIGWNYITDPLTFWHTISNLAVQHSSTYVVAHNLDYDMRILHTFSILPGIGWEPRTAIIGESCKFFKFGSGNNNICFVDNLNFWPTSLEELGQEFGLEPIAVDFYDCTDHELAEHCKRDVEILVKVWDYWLRFLDENHLGNFAITLAGQSWNAFRHRFMAHKIGIHNRKDVCDLERRSYRGGRCDVFKLGKQDNGPFYKLDVNGLYAYCMKTFEMPRKLVNLIENVTPGYLKKLLDQYCVIADVILDTDQPVYAVQKKGYNIYPVGTFQATLTTNELSYALDHGHIVAIGQTAFYEHAMLFEHYVSFFQEKRATYIKNGDNARQLMCKLFRNTLYGKAGQHGYSQEVVDNAPLDEVSNFVCFDADTGQEFNQITFGGKVIRQYQTQESDDSFPAIAAHVSAWARQVLWEYYQRADPAHVYYADTDSLIVDQIGYDNLADSIDQIELGFLKLEGKTDHLEIKAKKNYVFGGKRTTKGIKKNALQNKDGTFTQTQFSSIRWAFLARNLDDVVTTDTTVHESLGITHGTIDRQGICHPPHWQLDSEQVEQIVKPENWHSWTWWLDPAWFGTLSERPRHSRLSVWLDHFLTTLEVSEQSAQDALYSVT